MMIQLLTALPPNMPSTWFTAERLAQFWGYVKWFLTFNMPIFMICMAILVVWIFTDQITDLFVKKEKQKDEDEIETRYY